MLYVKEMYPQKIRVQQEHYRGIYGQRVIRGDDLQLARTDCLDLIRGNELQSERTSCPIRGNELLIRGNELLIRENGLHNLI